MRVWLEGHCYRLRCYPHIEPQLGIHRVQSSIVRCAFLALAEGAKNLELLVTFVCRLWEPTVGVLIG